MRHLTPMQEVLTGKSANQQAKSAERACRQMSLLAQMQEVLTEHKAT